MKKTCWEKLGVQKITEYIGYIWNKIQRRFTSAFAMYQLG